MKKKSILIGCLVLMSLFSQSQSFKFAVICDTRSNANSSGINGVNVAAVKAVCSHLKENGAELILAPGDFICGNVDWYHPNPPTNDTQYQTFLDAINSQGIGLPGSDQKVIIYPVRGNHECYHQVDTIYEHVVESWIKNIGYALPQNGPKGEEGLSYSFIHNNVLFLATDQYVINHDNLQDSIWVNQDWIDQTIQENPEVNQIFAFGHTPAFAAQHKDCLGKYPEKRNAFLRSIYNKSGVYFCGHDHFYARGEIPVYSTDGKIEEYMQQVITPSGAPFLGDFKIDSKWTGVYADTTNVIPMAYYDDVVGYQLITIEDDNVTVEFIATKDASNHWMDSKGKYHYTYNENWESWNFRIWDKFSYSIK